ncbi:MAG: hypothetical protein BWK80_57015 [Desulfobacteraceae bacterium IS3]|nr:MAG: hypothetical protein BWK80_57015 [Desulfobacteraceae bacterium IS3]
MRKFHKRNSYDLKKTEFFKKLSFSDKPVFRVTLHVLKEIQIQSFVKFKNNQHSGLFGEKK